MSVQLPSVSPALIADPTNRTLIQEHIDKTTTALGVAKSTKRSEVKMLPPRTQELMAMTTTALKGRLATVLSRGEHTQGADFQTRFFSNLQIVIAAVPDAKLRAETTRLALVNSILSYENVNAQSGGDSTFTGPDIEWKRSAPMAKLPPGIKALLPLDTEQLKATLAETLRGSGLPGRVQQTILKQASNPPTMSGLAPELTASTAKATLIQFILMQQMNQASGA